MSTSEQQSVELSIHETTVLRGAMNVAILVLERDPSVIQDFPLEESQHDVIERLNAEFGRRARGAPGTMEPIKITVQLDPVEAQAVRDTAGLVEMLLQTESGRELLTQVGWLRAPDQAVDGEELEQLRTIRQMIDPTGVRPEIEEPTGVIETDFPPDDVDFPPDERLIIEELTVTENLDRVSTIIQRQHEPWPGYEDAQDRVANLSVTFDEDPHTCAEAYLALIEITALAIAGQDHMPEGPQWFAGGYPPIVDDAYFHVLEFIMDERCLGADSRSALQERVDGVVNRLTPGVSRENIQEAGLQLLKDLKPRVEDVGTGELGAISDSEEALLGRIDQLRSEIEDVMNQTRETGLSNVEDQIESILPASGADCGELLVALAELSQLTGQVVAAGDQPEFETFVDRDGKLEPVNHARRRVLDKMGFGRVGVSDPLPGRDRECFPNDDTDSLGRIRSAIISIHDPLRGDDDNLETRVLNAMSLIRSAFQDPQRGP